MSELASLQANTKKAANCAIAVPCAVVYVCYVTPLLRIVLQWFVSRGTAVTSRKVPGTKSESRRAEPYHSVKSLLKFSCLMFGAGQVADNSTMS